MSRFFEVNENFLTLTGDTFSIKEEIKTLGGKWNSQKRCWVVPNSLNNSSELVKKGFIELNSSSQQMSEQQIKTFSTTQFLALFSKIIYEHCPKEFWLEGEISGLKTSNGHYYFDCADIKNNSLSLSEQKPVSVSCILWSGRKSYLQKEERFIPFEEGMKFRFLVQTEVKKNEPKINLIIQDIDPEFTIGMVALSRLAVIQDLKKRGLYHLNKTKKLNPVSLKIALLTSHGSRAETDFLNELQISKLAFCVTIFDCVMQGDQTSQSVCRALNTVEEFKDKYDVVVLSRGGGSKLDLRWFDDIEICKQIAYCSLPIICAIGHTEDISVADEVSFKMEKTPTGAARFLVQNILYSWEKISIRAENSAKKCSKNLKQKMNSVTLMSSKIKIVVKNLISRRNQKLNHLKQALRLAHTAQLSPLKRGFAVTTPSLFADFLALKNGDTLIVTKENTDDKNSTIIAEIHASVLKIHLKNKKDFEKNEL
jgi:exodeoxyribonuclease VII large subunit